MWKSLFRVVFETTYSIITQFLIKENITEQVLGINLVR